MTELVEAQSDSPARRSRLAQVGKRSRLAGVGNRSRLVQFSRLAAFTVAGLLAVWFAAGKWVSQIDVSSDEDVAAEWNHTVAQLGIEPVYPPEEDIQVGDIFLEVVDGGDDGVGPTLLNRSIKLTHIDVTKVLEGVYKETYVFPETLEKPAPDSSSTPQQVAGKSIFATGVERHNLPIVLFPGFASVRLRKTSTGAGWLYDGVHAMFGVTAEGQRSQELKIPFAETYGIGSLASTAFLRLFCEDERTKTNCTQDGARRQMATIIGSKAFEQYQDKNNPGQKRYRVNIEILLVSRVYLARSIQTVTQAGAVRGAQAKVAMELKDALQHLDADVPPGKTGTEASDTTETASLRRALKDEREHLEELISKIGTTPGAGSLSVDSAFVNQIAANGSNLIRPVVFGFRSARQPLRD